MPENVKPRPQQQPDFPLIQSVAPDQWQVDEPWEHPEDQFFESQTVQPVLPEQFSRQSSRQVRSTWWSTPSGVMPTWLLVVSWVVLGLPAMCLSIWSLMQVFFSEGEALMELASEILVSLLVAVAVNALSLVLFAILGRQTARKLQSQRRCADRRY